MHKVLRAMVAASLLGAHGPATAVTSLNDDFEAETASLSYNDFTNWDVVNGSVDTVSSGQFGISCAGGAGICVDLDGTSSNAGDLVSREAFEPGLYRVSFELSGNQRVSGSDSVAVSLGDLLEIIVIDSAAPFAVFSFLAEVDTDGDVLTFSHAGGDNFGLILDNVSVALVPLPGAALLLLSGLVAAGMGGRRR